MQKYGLGILIVLLLVLFGFLGFSFLNSRKSAVSPSPNPTTTPQIIPDTKPVSDLIDNYYKFYDSCMKNPPTAAKGMVGEYCQNNSGVTSLAFPQNIEEGGIAKAGADPIVCAQNFPESISVTNVSITDDQAVGIVTEKFGPTEIEVQIMVIKENRVWKIDNIVCPSP